jgi:hypothetical protein
MLLNEVLHKGTISQSVGMSKVKAARSIRQMMNWLFCKSKNQGPTTIENLLSTKMQVTSSTTGNTAKRRIVKK